MVALTVDLACACSCQLTVKLLEVPVVWIEHLIQELSFFGRLGHGVFPDLVMCLHEGLRGMP